MHLGTQTLAGRAKNQGYYWPSMFEDCKNKVQKCSECQLWTPRIKAPDQKMKPIVSPWPFMRWGMDIVGSIEPENCPRRYFLLATDYFTKWIKGETFKEIKEKSVAQFVERNILHRFGVPAYIVTNRGPQFIGKAMKTLEDKYKFELIHSSSKYAQANGQAERSNRTIVEEIKKRVAKMNHSWYSEFSDILWAYRTHSEANRRIVVLYGIWSRSHSSDRDTDPYPQGQPSRPPGQRWAVNRESRLPREVAP